MKRPLILAAVVALAIGLLALGLGQYDPAPSTHAQGSTVATATTAPTATATPTVAPIATATATLAVTPTTTTTAVPTAPATCNETTLGVKPEDNTGLRDDCNTLLRLRDKLSRPDTLNWSPSVPLERAGTALGWNGVTVGIVDGKKRVTGLVLEPYAFRNALAELATLNELVDLDLAVHTTDETPPTTPDTPVTGMTTITPVTTLPNNTLTCNATTLGESPYKPGISPRTRTALAEDCDTLLTIKSTLEGTLATGTAPLNWSPTLALTRWDGDIEVSGTPKRVTKLILNPRLTLSGIKLAGKIPLQIGNLTGLKVLNLGNNRLTGVIPTQIGKLTELREIKAHANQLEGVIPTQIENLTKLTFLGLGGNRVRGVIPTQIGKLTELTHIKVNSNRLEGVIPTQIEDLTELRILSLYGNQLTGNIPTQIGKLTLLENLNLHGNRQLGGRIPTQIGELTQLTKLVLHSTGVSGYIPTQLGNLANLQDLRMGGTSLIGSIPPQLGKLTALTRVGLNGGHTGCVPSGLPATMLPSLDRCPTGN